MQSQQDLLRQLGVTGTSKKQIGKQILSSWKKASKSKFYDPSKIPDGILNKLQSGNSDGLIGDPNVHALFTYINEVLLAELNAVISKADNNNK